MKSLCKDCAGRGSVPAKPGAAQSSRCGRCGGTGVEPDTKDKQESAKKT